MAARPLRINHAELVYPKGGKEAAHAALEVLGFTVSEGGPWLIALVDAATANYVDDVIFASEVTPAQLAFEEAFSNARQNDPELERTLQRHMKVRSEHPQWPFHFGVSIPTHEEWEARVARIQEAGRNHPVLAGKIEVAGRFEPGDPGAITHLSQAFIRTTALASELLATGLQFELQWAPTDENGKPAFGLVGEMPDLAALS